MMGEGRQEVTSAQIHTEFKELFNLLRCRIIVANTDPLKANITIMSLFEMVQIWFVSSPSSVKEGNNKVNVDCFRSVTKYAQISALVNS